MEIKLTGNLLIKHKKLPDCDFCEKCEDLLNRNEISYTTVYSDKWFCGDLMKATKSQNVPQIIINGEFVGNYEDLIQFLEEKL